MNDYGGWTVARLKNELTLRGASVRGRKKELIERLEAYDKYNNFAAGCKEDNTVEETMPWTACQLQPITSGFACPPVSLDQIWDFFNSGEDHFGMHPSALSMYRERWIVGMVAAVEERRVFFRAVVRSEMRKQVRYVVRIRTDASGTILNAHCECTAGAGKHAKCKHVATALYGVESLARSGQILTEKTCTDMAQKWHVPRRSAVTSSPKKAQNMRYHVHKVEDHDPVHLGVRQQQETAKQKTLPGEKDRLLNLIKNYQATKPARLNIVDCLGDKANMEAFCDDHDYLERPMLESLAEQLVEVTDAQIRDIEKATRAQATSARWFRERSIRLTASNFGAVMNMRDTTDPGPFVNRLVNPVPLKVPAVVWGKQNEGRARRAYETLRSAKVGRSGLVIDPAAPFLGCSPDGILSDRVVEIKGLYASRHGKVTSGVVDWLVEHNGTMQLKENSRYWYQVQGQMAILKKSLCDLVVFTQYDMVVIPVVAVPNLYEEVMVPKLRRFFYQHMARALVHHS